MPATSLRIVMRVLAFCYDMGGSRIVHLRPMKAKKRSSCGMKSLFLLMIILPHEIVCTHGYHDH